MKIRHEDGRVLHTRCTGCMCHDMAMQFGELNQGCCRECGCPKTAQAYELLFTSTRAMAPERATAPADWKAAVGWDGGS